MGSGGVIRPFEGLRVVDLSERFSGAFAARLFGDFGADVVLAESPSRHPLRPEPPFLKDEPDDERSVLHAYVHWNKRSLVIREAGELAVLAASADVLVTTTDPLTDGFKGTVLASLPPNAIHLSITAHG